MSPLELLGTDFMQRALVAALLTGLAAPTVGTFLVQRRLALMGDGIGHVAVTGVALGLLTGTSATWTAVVVAVLGAVLIEVIRERGQANGDVALALLFYGGLAGGILISGLGGQSTATLGKYLFGSITSISPDDVVVTLVLAAVVVALCVGLSPQLFAVAQDPEFARVAGLRVRGYNLMIAVLAAVSVTVAMRTVGLLLVSALMVVPVATAQQLTRSFRSTIGAAMALGGLASIGLVELFIGPVVAYFVTHRICIGLQKKDREIALHGYESSRIVRLPGGEYIEVHEQLSDYERWKLVDFDDYKPLMLRPNKRGRIPVTQRVRSVLSSWFFEDRIAPVTKSELEQQHAHH